METLTSDLTHERACCERLEADKATLERHLAEAREKLSASESQSLSYFNFNYSLLGMIASRFRAQIAASEERRNQIEHELNDVLNERNRLRSRVGMRLNLFSRKDSVHSLGEQDGPDE